MTLPKTVVVTALPEWPTSGTGGTLGFAYLLLRSLLNRVPASFDLYVLATNTMQLVRLESKDDLERLVATGNTSRMTTKGRIIKYLFTHLPYSRIESVRNLFARFRQSRRKAHQTKIRTVLLPLAAKYGQLICHVHDLETGDKILATCASSCSLALIHSEHGKGGMTREYTQVISNLKISDRHMRWLNKQYAAVFEKSSAIVFPSSGALELFDEANPKLFDVARNKTFVLRSGVAARLSHAIIGGPPDVHRIFVIAQHVSEKGIDRILRALSQCKQNGLSFNLRIAGGETLLSPGLYRLRDQLGLGANIEFLGAISPSQVDDELHRATLYLAAPRVVVFDLSLLEAMAAGLPIVTSKLTGNVEALGSDYEGYFETEDEFAPQIERVLREPQLASRLAKSNRDRCVSHFTLEKMADRYLDLYSRVAEHRLQSLQPS